MVLLAYGFYRITNLPANQHNATEALIVEIDNIYILLWHSPGLHSDPCITFQEALASPLQLVHYEPEFLQLDFKQPFVVTTNTDFSWIQRIFSGHLSRKPSYIHKSPRQFPYFVFHTIADLLGLRIDCAKGDTRSADPLCLDRLQLNFYVHFRQLDLSAYSLNRSDEQRKQANSLAKTHCFTWESDVDTEDLRRQLSVNFVSFCHHCSEEHGNITRTVPQYGAIYVRHLDFAGTLLVINTNSQEQQIR